MRGNNSSWVAVPTLLSPDISIQSPHTGGRSVQTFAPHSSRLPAPCPFTSLIPLPGRTGAAHCQGGLPSALAALFDRDSGTREVGACSPLGRPGPPSSAARRCRGHPGFSKFPSGWGEALARGWGGILQLRVSESPILKAWSAGGDSHQSDLYKLAPAGQYFCERVRRFVVPRTAV